MKTRTNSQGFTIVEITVVVIVVGILAAVTVFGYNGWRSSMAHNQMQSDLNNVKAAMDSARNFNNQYPTSVPATIVPSDGVTLTYKTGNATSYCIEATNATGSSTVYFLSSADSTTPKPGTCP